MICRGPVWSGGCPAVFYRQHQLCRIQIHGIQGSGNCIDKFLAIVAQNHIKENPLTAGVLYSFIKCALTFTKFQNLVRITSL